MWVLRPPSGGFPESKGSHGSASRQAFVGMVAATPILPGPAVHRAGAATASSPLLRPRPGRAWEPNKTARTCEGSSPPENGGVEGPGPSDDRTPHRPQPGLSLPNHYRQRRVGAPGPAPRRPHGNRPGTEGGSLGFFRDTSRRECPGDRGPRGGGGGGPGTPGLPPLPHTKQVAPPARSRSRPTARGQRTPAPSASACSLCPPPRRGLRARTHRRQADERAPTDRAADPPSALRTLAPRPVPPRARMASSRRPAPLPTHSSPRPYLAFLPAPICRLPSAQAQACPRFPPLRRRRAPPTAVGHIEAGGGGEVKRSLFSFTKMAACPCFATVPTL